VGTHSARSAAPDEFAQTLHLGGREHAAEVEIKAHARQFQQVGKQQFDIQARRVHTLFGEELRAALDHFKDGHRHTISLNPAMQSSKCRLHNVSGNPIFGA